MSFEQVKKVIVDTLNCDGEEISLSTNLMDDLGADSLNAVEISMALEEEFSIKIQDDELAQLRVVSEIVELIDKKLA